jgi:hypothetical protein
MALLALMGLAPGFNTAFGYLPLHGYEALLHALSALAAAFFGFRSLARAMEKSHHAEYRRSPANRRRATQPVAYDRRRGDRRYGGDTLAAG